ncbi:MAG: hypothetical protein HY720_04225 [Planctomycetes bacterium]|nr:hypothetical protein [Planctomycetota bacterium]
MRIALLWLALAGAALAQGLVKPEGFEVQDRPDDAGGGLIATWQKSPSDGSEVRYQLFGAKSKDGPWVLLKDLDSQKWFKSDAPQIFGFDGENSSWHFVELTQWEDLTNPQMEEEPLKNDKTFPTIQDYLSKFDSVWFPPGLVSPYHFRLEIVRGQERLEVGSTTALPKKNIWNGSRMHVFLVAIALSALILVMISLARKHPNLLFVRRLPGLDAVDEAIGRATEMGKPVLYLNGLLGLESVSTIASVSILGRLARRIAQYDSQILVPCYDPMVFPVCQEVVREAYMDAGRPDAFKEDSIFFVTNDQFSYVASVDGIMVREKPAANLYMGYYYAESLLLAETGASTGAIQIAGTDSVTQLPFFVATCDYTLMGEELYAASAYLSREPLQLGSLKGQDIGKAALMLLLVLGTVLTLSGVDGLTHWFTTF